MDEHEYGQDSDDDLSDSDLEDYTDEEIQEMVEEDAYWVRMSESENLDDEDDFDDGLYNDNYLDDVYKPETAARIRRSRELAEQNLSVAELKALGKSDYPSYLLTPHWLKTAEEARQRAGHKCQEPGCGKRQWKEHKFHVHHLNYDHLGEARPEDLMVLCPHHHRERHPDK